MARRPRNKKRKDLNPGRRKVSGKTPVKIKRKKDDGDCTTVNEKPIS